MKIIKTILITISLIAGTAATVNAHCGSCGMGGGESGEHKEHAGQDKDGRIAATALVPLYLDVQESLAADDLASAKSRAGDLHNVIDDSGHAKGLKTISEAAHAISKAANMPEARAAFKTLSDEMIAGSDALKLSKGQSLYVAYCPMAFDNKGGHWLQKDKTVNNPYYGAKMLRCGTIQKEIAMNR